MRFYGQSADRRRPAAGTVNMWDEYEKWKKANPEQHAASLRGGLIKGYTPDGLLVRVSTIDTDKEQAYKVQDRFIADLIAASPTKTRAMLLGNEADLVRQ